MPLEFVTRNENSGLIDDDLAVTYTGENGVSEPLEAYIREIEADVEPDEDVLSRLMFVLIGEYGIGISGVSETSRGR